MADWTEIVGFEDIVGGQYLGGDMESLLSEAAAGAQFNVQGMPARLAAALQAARGKQLVTRGPTKAREYPLGFDSGPVLVLAGAAAAVTSNPQVPFRGKRLAVAASTAASFIITDIRVGKNSQLVAVANIPAETFAQTAQGVAMSFDTAQVSQAITINVTNIALAPARFLATLIGDAVE